MTQRKFGPKQRMLIFTLEGFTPAAISAYGSSWNRTPAIDRMAAEGVTWNRAITPVTDPLEQWDRWANALADTPRAKEIVVITDDPRLLERESAAAFEEIVLLESDNEEDSNHEVETFEIEDTSIGRLTAVAADRLAQGDSVWLHSRFLTHCWDAPRELSDDSVAEEPAYYADEYEDDLPIETDTADDEDDAPEEVPFMVHETTPPDHRITAEDDPDWITTWMRTYGCQIKLVDAMLDVLDSVLEPDATVVLGGTSGFALGQNGGIGHRTGPWRSCHLHVPIVCSGGSGLRSRMVASADEVAVVISTRLSDPSGDLMPTERFVLENVENATTEESEPDESLRSDATSPSHEARVITQHRNVPIAITTNDWFYVLSEEAGTDVPSLPSDSDDRCHLYLKPDDFDDFNNVVRLRLEEADRLHQTLLNEFHRAE
ncbi:MAG TPA: sulfatase [Rhodopirellula baltica]|uniref:sulfatase n=1 Tax=Rhodopirellula baltica TaxID=265606 RepID=UPI0002D76D3F|nr:sulfatase [Rhodopirellula baltica]HBE66360.1 sulfatase [Rhodopirellula baltica]